MLHNCRHERVNKTMFDPINENKKNKNKQEHKKL